MEPTLLMLDEPTNHLDLNAVIWLDRLVICSLSDKTSLSKLFFCSFYICQLPSILEEDAVSCISRPKLSQQCLHRRYPSRYCCIVII